jgi:molecular chaperone GrpE
MLINGDNMPKIKPNKPKKSHDQQTKVQELVADLQRIQADFVNYRNRAEEERLKAIQTGKEQAVIAILPILDNIERAINHEPDDIKNHQWVKGVTAIAKQLEAQMEAIGLKPIGKPGEHFNPNLHEAAVCEDGDGANEVVESVIQNGYQFGDTVIRPAIVKVKRVN